MDKTFVVISIVNAIRDASPFGGFLKKDKGTGRWISIGDLEAREKVGHCLRDMIASTKEDPRNRKAGQIEKLTSGAKTASAPTSPFVKHPSKLRSSSIEMSAEQKLILRRLEAGFKGSVAELLGKTTTTTTTIKSTTSTLATTNNPG